MTPSNVSACSMSGIRGSETGMLRTWLPVSVYRPIWTGSRIAGRDLDGDEASDEMPFSKTETETSMRPLQAKTSRSGLRVDGRESNEGPTSSRARSLANQDPAASDHRCWPPSPLERRTARS